jgi:hypothetical protein
MNNRIINLKSYTGIESLKRFILQKLNLVDYKKDSIAEFDNRIKNYIERNKNLELILQLNRTEIEKDLRFRISLTSKANQPYPENFEMGNPHNRWLYDPIIKTEEETKREELELEKVLQDKLVILDNFLRKLRQLGSGKIIIKDF